MQDQINSAQDANAGVRELSLDEAEAVGGGFSFPHINWSGIAHTISHDVHTIVSHVESHNWNQVANDAKNGFSLGAVGGPWGALIGGGVGADYALFRQDFG